jgi:hypothetical protein
MLYIEAITQCRGTDTFTLFSLDNCAFWADFMVR